MVNKKCMFKSLGLLFFGIIMFIGCDSSQKKALLFPMKYPADNEQTPAKIELGKKLFFDTRLSKYEMISCASCHDPKMAFTDRVKFSNGVQGNKSFRNAPTLINVGYAPTLMFDGQVETLEMQALIPIEDHREMSMDIKQLIEKLKRDPEYAKAAKEIYNRAFDPWVLTRSLAAYQRSLIAMNSSFDKYFYQGEPEAMSEKAKEGWNLFSNELYCINCHMPPHFTSYKAENNGLYETFGVDKGRFRITGDSTDIGKFKVPTLRNITLTYPYMHDGSMATLIDVLEHYQNGGKNHFNKSGHIKSFTLSPLQQDQLLAFFEALTDTCIVAK